MPSVTLLFDWWKGQLPPQRPGIPLLVFASHWHEDHFSPAIFSLHADAYLLGGMDRPWLARKGASPETLERCITLKGSEVCHPLPGVTVETLPSTDEGVAFLVTCDGHTVFHAGDLNWWHWEGEPDPWNPQMEADFKRYAEPLRRRRLDLAFLPLDPRQQSAESWGFAYLMDLADIRRAFPMHQWNDYSPTDRLLSARPDLWERVVPVSREGQQWHFPD